MGSGQHLQFVSLVEVNMGENRSLALQRSDVHSLPPVRVGTLSELLHMHAEVVQNVVHYICVCVSSGG